MHRAPLLRLLAEYRERLPSELAAADRFTQFVRDHPDCFERSLEIGHLTGSAWILARRGARVLLTHHRKLGIWVQLGGHADGDPDLLGVATREALEESGLVVTAVTGAIFDLDVHRIPARDREPAHLHYDVRFLMSPEDAERLTLSDESYELAWVPLRRLGEYTDEPSMLRMRDKTPKLRPHLSLEG